MLRKERKILFIRQGSRSFFETDLEILEKSGKVFDFDNYPPSLIKLPNLFRRILECDIVYVWFMGRHAVLPIILAKLLGKKIILVAGGWDVANCPEIDYGLMQAGLLAMIVKQLFKFPDMILSISASNHQELLKNVGISQARSRMIYLGFKDEALTLKAAKEKMVVTIGEVNQSNLKRKGLELYVNTAKEIPEIPFIVIGKWASDGAIEYLKKIAPSNVQFTGHLAQSDKDQFLARAMVYAQLSFHEAFGCAVAEAMQHGCVPVVTNQFALPEVVGDSGVIVERSAAGIKKGILEALENSSKFKPERRIVQSFSYTKRSLEIQKAIERFL